MLTSKYKTKVFKLQTERALLRGYLSVKNFNAKYENVDSETVLRRKKSNIITILGSGYSINYLSKNQWEFINNNDSIGMNKWFYHATFVPTFYHIIHYKGSDAGFIIFKRRWNEVKEKYKDLIFFISKTNVLKAWHPKYRPDVFPDNPKLFIYSKAHKKAITAEKAICIDDLSDFSRNLGENVYLVRGSLTSIIHLCYQMGYKKILLAGIDLCDIDGRRYFWEADAYPEWIKPRMEPTIVYNSTNPNYHPITNWGDGRFHAVETFLPALNELIFKPEGKEMFLANKCSLLYPELRVFNFKPE